MANIDVTITYDSLFGSEGTGNGNFKYPQGILVFRDEIYVSDTQNHRVQVFNLSGVYQRQFGSGTFLFPDGITTNGEDIFIADSENETVQWCQTDGTIIFGYFGSFYKKMVDLRMIGDTFVLANRSNSRLTLQPRAAGTVKQTAAGELLFPEGVEIFNNFIVICDSGNHRVKVYNQNLTLTKIIDYEFGYPFGLCKVGDDAIIVIDQIAQELVVFDEQFNFVTTFGTEGSSTGEFFFPRRAFYYDDKLYVSDSGNHRVQILNITVERDTTIYSNTIMKLNRVLYPTGRAFQMNQNSYFYKLHQALADSESRAVDECTGILNSLIPDNDEFSTTDADNWERALAVISDDSATLEERKTAILQRMAYPDNYQYRGGAEYIEQMINDAGFIANSHIVKIFKNEIPILPTPQDYTIVANHVEEDDDYDFFTGQTGFPQYDLTIQYRATFIIARSTTVWPTSRVEVDVYASRKREFREFLLRIMPAHTVAILYVNYV